MKELINKVIKKRNLREEKIKKIVGNIEEKFNEIEGEEAATKEAVEEALRKLEKTPGLSEAVLRELLIRQNVSNSVPVETIKNIPESGIPTETVVKVVEKLSDKLPDSKMLEIADETDLELKGKQQIIEAVSDPDKKKQKQEELMAKELEKIHKKVKSKTGDFEVLENVNKILQINLEFESEKINKLVNEIITKKMVLNYMNYNSIMPRKFATVMSIEEMFSRNFPKVAECEYKKMERIEREEAKYEFQEARFREDLLKEMAKNIAENYKKNGYKRLAIPQSETMRGLSHQEEKKFISQISEEVKRRGGKLDALSELDAKGQIRGNIEESEKIEEYVTKIGELPQSVKIDFIEQGKKIITDEELMHISNYCNKVGLYQALAEIGQEQAEKAVNTFLETIEKVKKIQKLKSIKIRSKEEIPNIKAKKFNKDIEER